MIRGVTPLSAAPALAALLFAAACGGESATPTPVQQAIQERIVRLEAGGQAEELLLSVKELMQQKPPVSWIDQGDWNLGRNELNVVWKLNTPDKKQGRTVIRALDFECPEHPLHVMLEYERELEERGIDLLIVPVINRAQLWFDRMPNVSADEQCLGGDLAMPRLLLEMSKAGLDIVDLYPALAAARTAARSRGEEADLFLKYNPHWSPSGVVVGAETIAERIRAMEWFQQGPNEEGKDYHRVPRRIADTQPRHGEVPEEPELLQFDCVVDGNGKPIHASDRNSPVLLLADSYGGVYTAQGSGLSTQLHRLLGFPLDRIVIPSGGENPVWQSVARRGDDLKGKKLVIWVFRVETLLSRELTKIDIFQD